MILNGTSVQWKDKNTITKGIVKDCYQFQSKQWADKYQCAYLIEQSNKTFVLKVEPDIQLIDTVST